MVCSKCGSHDVKVQMVSDVKTKNRGCLGWFFWILLAILTIGLIIIIPLITNSKTSVRHKKVAICQSCGKHWNI